MVLIGTYLIGAAVWFSTRHSQEGCSAIEWQIQDTDERQYVTEEGLTMLINHTNLSPEGKPAEQVMTQAIETCVNNHPMVRDAQCFITNRGQVIVRLTQRIPLFGVKASGESYYIDTDRLRMPLSPRITDTVIWVTGNVDEKMAQTQLADIVLWLNKKAYWENRIATVEVKANHEIVLKDKSGLDIIVGHGQGFESKMNKLRVFEEQMAKVGGKKYKTLDIRYKDQVIGKE